mmetsp:Transcript_16852/g.34511  ORF Transcript_16852/g.34511 Transcript_16852/m.34511 type:complete len:449 (-) Transcript_16852:168-1514(-)
MECSITSWFTTVQSLGGGICLGFLWPALLLGDAALGGGPPPRGHWHLHLASRGLALLELAPQVDGDLGLLEEGPRHRKVPFLILRHRVQRAQVRHLVQLVHDRPAGVRLGGMGLFPLCRDVARNGGVGLATGLLLLLLRRGAGLRGDGEDDVLDLLQQPLENGRRAEGLPHHVRKVRAAQEQACLFVMLLQNLHQANVVELAPVQQEHHLAVQVHRRAAERHALVLRRRRLERVAKVLHPDDQLLLALDEVVVELYDLQVQLRHKGALLHRQPVVVVGVRRGGGGGGGGPLAAAGALPALRVRRGPVRWRAARRLSASLSLPLRRPVGASGGEAGNGPGRALWASRSLGTLRLPASARRVAARRRLRVDAVGGGVLVGGGRRRRSVGRRGARPRRVRLLVALVRARRRAGGDALELFLKLLVAQKLGFHVARHLGQLVRQKLPELHPA